MRGTGTLSIIVWDMRGMLKQGFMGGTGQSILAAFAKNKIWGAKLTPEIQPNTLV